MKQLIAIVLFIAMAALINAEKQHHEHNHKKDHLGFFVGFLKIFVSEMLLKIYSKFRDPAEKEVLVTMEYQQHLTP